VGQTTRNGEYSLEIVPCLGACSKSPVISINGILYGSITAENLEEILEEAART